MSYDPRFTRTAQFGRKNFTVSVKDLEEDDCLFLGYFDYKRDSSGVSLVYWEYWPINPELEESVYDCVLKLLNDL
jgi:hypothetical protein